MAGLYHGGGRGLRVGDEIVPTTGGRHRDGCPICEARAAGNTVVVDGEAIDGPNGHADRVYVTTSRLYARYYASLAGLGDLTATCASAWPLPGDAPVYRYWDNEIRSMNLPTWQALSGRVIEFDPYDFHRARPAERTGWRWFARLTLNPGPRPDVAKVRAQTQVYLPVTNEGW